MFRGSRSRATIALFTVVCALAPVTIASTATPADAAATLAGPLISKAENATTSWGRDGGLSVPLPNGKVFWVFGDTPRYTYSSGKWKLTGFIYGSTAGLGTYKSGKAPSSQFTEVNPGRALKATNQPRQLLPTPKLYMPNGSGKVCNKANGGPSAGAARWPTGAMLLPDKTNILISYIGVCVISARNFRAESWGFARFNWKTSRFTTAPIDVFPAAKSGAELARKKWFGSPVLQSGKVVFFTGEAGPKIYRATVGTKVSALRKPSSYAPTPISGLTGALVWSIAPKSKSRNHLTMYKSMGAKGQYQLLKAPSPAGPWKKFASGTLPKCGSAPGHCNSFAVHPEMSTSSRLLVSYYLPGFGPGMPKKHPYPKAPLGHIVMAWATG
jgi:hypothetical protein